MIAVALTLQLFEDNLLYVSAHVLQLSRIPIKCPYESTLASGQ